MAHLPETQFRMTRGDAKSYRVTVKDDAGAVVNLTGATIRAQFRKHPHSAPVITLNVSSGIEIENAAGGVFRIDLTPAHTSALGNWEQTYGFDVQVTKDDKPVTVVRGTLTIEPDYSA